MNAQPKKRRNNLAQAKKTMENKHPVSLLSELAAKRKWYQPMYENFGEKGPQHSKQFVFTVIIKKK